MSKTGPISKLARAGAIGVAAMLAVAASAANAPELAMLESLAKGSWSLRIRDDGSQQRVCVRSGQEFIQLRHTQPGCSRFVVKDTPEEVVVQYTCRGNGYGRTSIRREGNGLVQIQSQGIIDGAPFAISGEARHAGSC
jgi:hypothetical protein